MRQAPAGAPEAAAATAIFLKDSRCASSVVALGTLKLRLVDFFGLFLVGMMIFSYFGVYEMPIVDFK
jgi:hypothetical protein